MTHLNVSDIHVFEVYTCQVSQEWGLDNRINAPRTSVIGPYNTNPNYVDLAKSINGNYFQLPTETWDSMTPAQRIFENKVFLDDAIGRGDTFRVSTNTVDPLSDTAQEIKYILGDQSKFGQTSTGYTRSADGVLLIPPAGR